MKCQYFKDTFPEKYQFVKNHMDQLKQQRTESRKLSTKKRLQEQNQGFYI